MQHAMLQFGHIQAMKIFKYNMAHVFARPSVQGWQVVFACGFLTMCIIGLMLCIGVWLIVKVLRRLPTIPLPDWDVMVMSTEGVVLQIAAVFGALLTAVTVPPSVEQAGSPRPRGHAHHRWPLALGVLQDPACAVGAGIEEHRVAEAVWLREDAILRGEFLDQRGCITAMQLLAGRIFWNPWLRFQITKTQPPASHPARDG